MTDAAEGMNIFASASALRAARRGDYSRIEARAKSGAALMPEELDLLERRDRGAKLKRGQKDPQIDAEMIVLCRWLNEVEGIPKMAAYSFVGEMTCRTADAVQTAVRRAARTNSLGANIADYAFNRHAQVGEKPPLLQARGSNWKCLHCDRVQCCCDPAPRPSWDAGTGAATVRTLIRFLQP